MGNRVIALLGALTITLLAAPAFAQIPESVTNCANSDDPAQCMLDNLGQLPVPNLPLELPQDPLFNLNSAFMSTIDARAKDYGWNDPVQEAYGPPLAQHQTFPVYADMDLDAQGKPIAQTPDQIAGQNNWNRYAMGNWIGWEIASVASGRIFSPIDILDPRQPNPDDPTRRLATADPDRFGRWGAIRAPGYNYLRDDDGKVLPNMFGLFLDQDKADQWRNFKIDGMSGMTIDNLVLNPADATDPLHYQTYGTQGPQMGWTFVFNPKFVRNVTKKVGDEWVTTPNPLYDADAVQHWEDGLVMETFMLRGVPTQLPVARNFYGEAPDALRSNPATTSEQLEAAEKAAAAWRADGHLEVPQHFGATCTACHTDISPDAMDPLNAANFLSDPEHPQMRHLTSTRGRPNFVQASFVPNLSHDNLLWQLNVHALERGGNDTSALTPPDAIMNGDNDINPVHGLLARVTNAPLVKIYKDDPERWVVAEFLRNQDGPLSNLYKVPIQTEEGTGREFIEVPAPRVLKTGGDVGVGAASGFLRVNHNIMGGWQHVMSKSNMLIPAPPQEPMSIREVYENNVWTQTLWNGVNQHVDFMLQSPTTTLDELPGGRRILEREGAMNPETGEFTDKWQHGMKVFAHGCMECHSAEQPGDTYGKDRLAAAEQFLTDNIDRLRQENYWCNEREVYGADTMKTVAARAFGTNATEGNLWANWSDDGELFKSRPQIGPVRGVDPSSFMNSQVGQGETQYYGFQNPANGAGYYRCVDLAELWFRGGMGHGNNIGGGSNDPAIDAMIQGAKVSTNIEDKYAWAKEAFQQLMDPTRRRGLTSVPVTEGNTWLPIPEWAAPLALNRIAASEAFPWNGKTVDPVSGWGVNRMRVPGREGLTDMWFFKIGPRESALRPGTQSLVLDYEAPTCGEVRALVANPPSDFWASKTVPAYCEGKADSAPANEPYIQRIWDEIRPVTVRTNTRPEGVTVYVGPAMAKRDESTDEVLWFALSPTNDTEALYALQGLTSDQLRERYTESGGIPEGALNELAGSNGMPLGRVLAIRSVEQGETQGPVHDLLEQAGYQLPELKLGPFPPGTPLALTNIKPEAIPGLIQQMVDNRVLSRWQSLEGDPEALREYFVNTIVPAITPHLKAPVQEMDGGHYIKTKTDPRDPEYTRDHNTANVPYSPVDNPDTPEDERRGYHSDYDNEALWLFLSTL